jgi:hypothetical protein
VVAVDLPLLRADAETGDRSGAEDGDSESDASDSDARKEEVASRILGGGSKPRHSLTD